MILITHEHADHLDLQAIQAVSKNQTEVLINESGYKNWKKVTYLRMAMRPLSWVMLRLRLFRLTIPRREEMYHPRHRDNGYVPI